MAEKEYIERGALYEELNSLSVTVTGLRCGKGYLKEIVEHYQNSVLRIVNEQPTADVAEVRHGEWVAKDHVSISKRGRFIEYSTYKCSICGKWNGRHKQNFCPNCGAKMDGERKEQK